MQLKTLVKIEDIKYVMSQFFDLETKMILGKIIDENFLNHFNFNVDYNDIINVSKIERKENLNNRVNMFFNDDRIRDRYKLYEMIANRDHVKTKDLIDVIRNSLDTLWALEAISMVEFYNDLDFLKYEIFIISDIKHIYNSLPFDIDISKFCLRCGKFGHEALRTCNGCLLFNEKYEKQEDKVLRLMTEDYEIRHKNQTKVISECRLNRFISQQDKIVLENFRLLESNKISEEIELYRNFNKIMSQKNNTTMEELRLIESNRIHEEREDVFHVVGHNIPTSTIKYYINNIENWDQLLSRHYISIHTFW
jgi:hypothetical protein